MIKKEFNVTGMTCAACQANVEKTIKKLPGVESVSVNLLNENMLVSYNENETRCKCAYGNKNTKLGERYVCS